MISFVEQIFLMDSVEIRVARIEETLNTVIGKLHDLSGSVAGGFEKIDKNLV